MHPGFGSTLGSLALAGLIWACGDTSPGGEVSETEAVPDTFRIAPLQGRLFDDRDRLGTLPVTVINESMAKMMVPDGSALGQRLRYDLDADATWYTVIGVGRDTSPMMIGGLTQRDP